jgi:hypothetical protein
MNRSRRDVTRREALALGLALGCAMGTGCASVPLRAQLPAKKKLIEFGWDEPDTAFLRRHIARMEETPFDGCVFRIHSSRPDGVPGPFLWEAWGRHPFAAAECEAALADLQATPFHRFTDNFLRFNVTPGDVDWFDDFSAIAANARLAAWVARAGGARGILFDVEQYVFPLFTHARQSRADRVGWELYAEQTRGRGREVMEAFQDGYPDLTILFTFAYSLPWRLTRGGQDPLAHCEYGLLVPFLDGMVDAARGGTKLVDGCELAYFHEKDTRFFPAMRQTISQDVLALVGDPARYRRRFSVAFGLWMDYESSTRGWNGVDGERNPYSPGEFERSVRAALQYSDEFVWIYSEIPRWWSVNGGPVDLPVGYADALHRAHRNAHSRSTP